MLDPTRAPAILSVGRAFPPHETPQAELTRAFSALWPEGHPVGERLPALHRAATVRSRHVSLPPGEIPTRFKEANDAFIRIGLEVGERAIRDALARANVEPHEVDHLWYVTVTGLSTPSLDATLANRLGLRTDVKRVPVFGLGCAAGAALIGRITDLLRGHPRDIAVLLAVELCTLTVQRNDLSMTNAVATGLFGDGAAAVVLAGSERAVGGVRALDSTSVLIPNSEAVMGWDFTDTGFKVVLSTDVPEVVRGSIGPAVDALLRRHGLSRADVRHWISHPGGPKVLQAIEEALELDRHALARSWRSLETVGNISSVSVLLILGDTLAEAGARPGDLGVIAAMGPGFGAELTLIRWT